MMVRKILVAALVAGVMGVVGTGSMASAHDCGGGHGSCPAPKPTKEPK